MNQPERLIALSDEELARLCARLPVNDEAWNVFYSRFYVLVYSKIRKRLWLNTAQIEDVVQEAFTKIFEALPSYDPGTGALGPFLSTIAGNVAIDLWRHGATEEAHTVALADDILAVRATGAEGVHQLAARIVGEIPDRRKVPVVLALIRGEDVKAICAKQKRTKYEVYVVRKWLKQWLKKSRRAKSLNTMVIKNSE